MHRPGRTERSSQNIPRFRDDLVDPGRVEERESATGDRGGDGCLIGKVVDDSQPSARVSAVDGTGDDEGPARRSTRRGRRS